MMLRESVAGTTGKMFPRMQSDKTRLKFIFSDALVFIQN